MLDKYFERQLKYEKQLALKIWDTPFAVSCLKDFSKKELVTMLNSLLDFYSDEKLFECDAKDILFSQKCDLIESLDPEFFKRDDKERDL